MELGHHFGIFVLGAMAASVAGLFIFLSEALGPKQPTAGKAMPYECGKPPFELPTGRHAVKFYLGAMLFVVFDVELIFFFPWAVIHRSLGWIGFLEMLFFIAVLALGFGYALRKGALEWK